MYAVLGNHLTVVKELMTAQAELKTRDKVRHNYNLYHFLYNHQRRETGKVWHILYLSSLDQNCSNTLGYHACNIGCIESIRMYIITVMDGNCTWFAVRCACYEMTFYDCPQDGRTALEIATAKGHIEIAELLERASPKTTASNVS